MTGFPGLGVAGYRSLSDTTLIDVRERFNVILGATNAGKSNIMRVLAVHLQDFWRAAVGGVALTSMDARHDRARANPGSLTVYWPIDTTAALAAAAYAPHGTAEREVSELFDAPIFQRIAGVPLLELTLDSEAKLVADGEAMLQKAPNLPWHELSRRLTSEAGGKRGDDTGRVLNWIRRSHLLSPPPTILVPPARTISAGSTDDWDFSGAGIIERLDDLRNADFDRPDARELYALVCSRLGSLLEEPRLDYVVPRSRDTVNIRLNSDYFPLHALGTGTAHVVLLVVAATVYPGHMLCLEEPDAHLHPRLQRRVAALLRTQTQGKIVVATHSAHWIDLSTDHVLSVIMSRGSTRAEIMHYPTAFSRLAALGYRASDLLQANAIVWVEGPSDRIYVNHWIRLLAPSLVEGVHYSVMFFGGSLLAHLQAPTGPDYADPDLVDLWRINQQMWVIVDSDRTTTDAPLKPRVERLQAQIEASGRGGIWVTAGRTIENYVPIATLEAAVREVHPTVERIVHEAEPATDLLRLCSTAEGNYLKTVDKVAVATAVTSRNDSFNTLDVRQRTKQLVAFIQYANE